MVGWWPGDGNPDDIVGGNNGTLEGGAGFSSGEVGEAFSLNGNSQYVDVPTAQSIDVSQGDFTVDAWVNFSSLTQGGSPCSGNGCDMSIVDKM